MQWRHLVVSDLPTLSFLYAFLVSRVGKHVTHLHETSRMSAEFVFRYGPKCMGGVILPILVLLHL